MDSNHAFITFKEPSVMTQIFATQLQVYNLSIQFKAEELDVFYPRKFLLIMYKEAGSYPDYLAISILYK